MRTLALLPLLVCAGCQQPAQKQDAPPPTPVARFQAIPDGMNGYGVYVLDTRDGRLAHCTTTMGNVTWCTPTTDVQTGGGPPRVN